MRNSSIYIAYHLSLFISLVLFYLYTIYYHINDYIYECLVLIVLTLGVVFKVVYDWYFLKDDLNFAFSSAIVPIYFTCFEFSHHILQTA